MYSIIGRNLYCIAKSRFFLVTCLSPCNNFYLQRLFFCKLACNFTSLTELDYFYEINLNSFGYNAWRDPMMKPTKILEKLCKDVKIDAPDYSAPDYSKPSSVTAGGKQYHADELV